MRVLRARRGQPPVGHPHAVPQEPAAPVSPAPQPAPLHPQLRHQLHQLQLQHQELSKEPGARMQLHHLRATQRPECEQSPRGAPDWLTEQPVHERVRPQRQCCQLRAQHSRAAIFRAEPIVNEW